MSSVKITPPLLLLSLGFLGFIGLANKSQEEAVNSSTLEFSGGENADPIDYDAIMARYPGPVVAVQVDVHAGRGQNAYTDGVFEDITGSVYPSLREAFETIAMDADDLETSRDERYVQFASVDDNVNGPIAAMVCTGDDTRQNRCRLLTLGSS